MNGLLLDTHVWLWTLLKPQRLPVDLRERLGQSMEPVFLSSASSWEICIKYSLGRLPLPDPPEDYIPPRLLRDNILGLSVEHRHALETRALPSHHADPFDRILVAQARTEGLVLVTADRSLKPYPVDLWVI